ncbi:hypothetical protein [Planctomicrobium sp. SH527]|uniref:hypothetical protein n=1 Tax=Planctomicrobium sp. SH527 TaxID=3448123 RepID=UPI003F5C1A66
MLISLVSQFFRQRRRSPVRLLFIEQKLPTKIPQEVEETLIFPEALPDFGDESLTKSLNSLLSRYVHSVSREELMSIDTDSFLAWMMKQKCVTAEQRAIYFDLFAPRSVELLSLQKRLEHARFEELSSRPVGWKQRILSSRTLVILNPSHLWAAPPAATDSNMEYSHLDELLYYQVSGEIRMAAVEATLAPLIKALSRGPVSSRAFVRQLDSSGCKDWCVHLKSLLDGKVLAIS